MSAIPPENAHTHTHTCTPKLIAKRQVHGRTLLSMAVPRGRSARASVGAMESALRRQWTAAAPATPRDPQVARPLLLLSLVASAANTRPAAIRASCATSNTSHRQQNRRHVGGGNESTKRSTGTEQRTAQMQKHQSPHHMVQYHLRVAAGCCCHRHRRRRRWHSSSCGSSSSSGGGGVEPLEGNEILFAAHDAGSGGAAVQPRIGRNAHSRTRTILAAAGGAVTFVMCVGDGQGVLDDEVGHADRLMPPPRP